jgi:hypothetical protein
VEKFKVCDPVLTVGKVKFAPLPMVTVLFPSKFTITGQQMPETLLASTDTWLPEGSKTLQLAAKTRTVSAQAQTKYFILLSFTSEDHV